MEKKILRRLTEVQNQFNKLEMEKNKILEDYIDTLAHTLSYHKTKLKAAEFKEAIANYWKKLMLHEGGTDYFAWVPEKEQKADFAKFIKSIPKRKELLFYNNEEYQRDFFYLRDGVHKHCTVRSSNEVKKITLKKNIVNYMFKVDNYNGFGCKSPGSFLQTFSIDTKTDKVFDHHYK